MSNLIDHAKRELRIIGEDPETSAGILKVVQAFDDMHPSGGSADVIITIIHQLLQQQNLSPLTADLDEWQFHANETYGLDGDAWNNGQSGIWQNKRNSEAFSSDHGKTYWFIHENLDKNAPKVIHQSRLARAR